VLDAVLDDCQPETYTVSRYLAICVTCTGSSLQRAVDQQTRSRCTKAREEMHARSVSVRRCAALRVLGQQPPELLAQYVGRVRDGERPPLGDDLRRGVRTLHAREPRAL
jgi:hypothetical protein